MEGTTFYFFGSTYACTGLIILSLVNHVRNVVLDFGFLWQWPYSLLFSGLWWCV